MNTNIHDQICNPANLNLAYARIRLQTRRSTFDQLAVADYERHLELNLADLALRLLEGRYLPVSARDFDDTGSPYTQTMQMIEDHIVQRAMFDAIAPLFEPAFLDCSFGSHRNRETSLAVRQVLAHRARGDNYIVSADISEWPDGYDHDNLLYLLGTQINEQRVLSLIRKWLDEIGNDRSSLANNRGVDPRGFPEDFKQSLKRLGVDAARITLEASLLALASNPRHRHLFTKRNLALASAAALAAAAYPAASRLLSGRLLAEAPGQSGARASTGSGLSGGPLAGLLTDITLHRFDVAMTGAGLRLVRYQDQFAITTTREAEARSALDLAASELHRMDIPLSPQKARIERFETGVEFLGYRIHEYEDTAELIEPDDPTSFMQWREQISQVIRQAPSQLWPAAAQIGRFAKSRFHAGCRQIKSALSPSRNHEW